MTMRRIVLAALCLAVALAAPPAPAAEVPASGCAPVGTIQLAAGDRFEIGLPRGVVVQAPGAAPVSFLLDIAGAGGPRLDYDEPSGLLRVRNGLLVGAGRTWVIYPASAPCRRLAARLGGSAAIRATAPGDPASLPQNSITIEPGR